MFTKNGIRRHGLCWLPRRSPAPGRCRSDSADRRPAFCRDGTRQINAQADPAGSTSAADTGPVARQHDLISEFGLFAIREDRPERVLDEACRVAAQGLGTRFAKVLRFEPERGDFLLCSGVGWHPGTVGHARIDGVNSPAAVAFREGEAVLSNDAVHDKRFRLPALLSEHGVRSALNVPIGLDRRLGVLEVDATEREAFTAADTAFLRLLAVTLTVALEKQERVAALARSETQVRTLLETSPDCVKVLDRDGRLRSMNANGLRLLDHCDFGALEDTPWTTLWPQDEAGKVEAAVAAALGGGVGRFEAFAPTFAGIPKWWDVVVAPLHGEQAAAGQLVAISRDVTDRVLAIRAKDQMLRDKDLLILEIHHRVKNSLQLVQNLLALQARASGGEASRHLNESATRVRTISAIHDRLYKAGGAMDVEVDLYLEGLVEDLRGGMASAVDGRRILLESASVTWPAISVPTLGLVLTELVTNSLKYGAGDVRVRFTQDADGAVLSVEDDGVLPDDFNPQQGSGLGMRLVSGLLRGDGAGLTLDRSRGTACFVARLPRHRTMA